MTVVDTSGPAWMPTRYSPPLSEDFPTHGDWLLKLVDLVWVLPGGGPIELDEWQRWLIRHMLEVFPEGHPRAGELRFRQVVVSMGRQNGKSVLGAILGLYGLVREAGALVIGLASSADQAGIIYTRLLAVIKGHRSLAKKFHRLTETRGIAAKDGGRYLIKASKSAAVQGLDVSVGLADELHLMQRALWSDLVNGTAARRNGIVIGITTAGDEDSTLLKQLYALAEPGQHGERFGFFIWEAPEALVPRVSDAPGAAVDVDALGAYIIAANPSVACGRMDLDTIISDVLDMPEVDVIRYRLNRFVGSSAVFLSPTMWAENYGEVQIDRPLFAVDRSPDWGFATIVAAQKRDGKIHTEVVASFVQPTQGALLAACERLAPMAAGFVMDGYTLRALGNDLKRRGCTVTLASLGDVTSGSAMLYAKVKQKRLVVSAADVLLLAQLPRAVRKNVGEGFRISRSSSVGEIDSVIATMLAVYYAETLPENVMQIF